jgi:hypothetical protein
VNVLPQGDGSNEIVVCFMPDPDVLVGEGESKACLCLDASKSIKQWFGEKTVFMTKPNYVQAVASKLGAILCSVTKSGKVSTIYWALSPGGGDIEEIGEFDAAGCGSADISGPKQHNWGTGTRMLPAIQYVVETVAKDADWTMGVIVTDGIIEDEADCMEYCMKLGELISNDQHPEVKLVLIGVGDEVDEGQLERFDDMFEDTALEGKVDLWSSGIAFSMEDEADILGVLFGELVSEEMVVATSGSVLDGTGAQIASYADGLPAKLRFVLPKGQTTFTVHTPDGEVAQDISEALNP